MSSISSMDTVRPPRSPSPASSPTLEDDIAHNKSWLTYDVKTTDVDRKGKSREHHSDFSKDNTELSDPSTYPPKTDQEAETRRVEETLRQWEVTERQRRRAARESGSSGTIVASSSLLSNATRRASQLWRNGSRKRHPSIGGRHTALSSTDNLDIVPLEDIAASPTPTPSPPRTPSPYIPSFVRECVSRAEDVNSDHHSAAENPFENPRTPSALEALSPFADTHRIYVEGTRTTADKVGSHAEGKRHSRLPPPPMPLDLPRPKTPPPVAISTPPYTTDPPDATHLNDREANGKPTRWWHEWLCGCGEGPDRGGDYQAGRTNPFE